MTNILILDFGSQYTQLIARRVREIGVYCEIYPFDVDIKLIKDFAPKGIILSGGPETVIAKTTPRAPAMIFDLGCPVLGICYGMQTMAVQLGGKVTASKHSEYGHAAIEIVQAIELFHELKNYNVWMSHGDQVTRLPQGFVAVAKTTNSKYAAIANPNRHFYGLQFHPEVTHTPEGEKILKQFVLTICKCKRNWTTKKIITEAVQNVKQQVGNDQVVLGLSGGVDSSVVALLLHEAIGDQLTCVFVDTGLLRLNEGDEVMQTFAKYFGIKIIRVNAAKRFLKILKGVSDPEQKRKLTGKEFIKIFQQEAKKLTRVNWLAQGTIYPDVIESAAAKYGKSQVIKSHHNVGGLPKKMHLKLVEPIRELFKDEVRKVGIELGLPPELIYRHPFPGPGLGIRILGEVKPQYADILRQVDHIFMEELHAADLYKKVSQAFAVFLPVKSVGVTGDQRRYEYVVALRAVETIDFMTAHWSALPHEFLSKVSNRIMNEVAGISRVVYDISGKPPATIEWE